MKAFLKNYRQSPRKVSLVAGLIKGKRVAEAFVLLRSLPKRASLPVSKLLSSAVSNAKAVGVSEENLYIKNITVDKGIVLKRVMPRARGSASRINKRTSHILITLEEKNSVAPIKKSEKKIESKVKKVTNKSKAVKKTEPKA